MELFASESTVSRLESELAAVASERRPPLMAELAWHLRQRDTARAEELARDALRQLDGATGAEAPAARLAVTRAECALLMARLDEAETLAREAHARFESLGDRAGMGDCAFVQARIAEARGERERELPRLEAAVADYRAGGDAERLGHARAAALLARAFGDPASLGAELAAIRSENESRSPALEAYLRFIEGIRAFQRGAFLDAVPALSSVRHDADAWGMIEHGLRAEMGLVSAYSNLGDRETCCTLAESVLARVRSLGWPRMIGHALANLGRQLANVQQPARALELLNEAHALLSDEPRSRGFAIASYYLGDACLALRRDADALAHLEHAERLMRGLEAWPEVACLQAIAAQALSRLGRPQEALARAEAGLALSRQTKSRLWEVEALRSLAEIHSNHPVPGAEGAGARSLPLRFLEEALAVVDAIGGHHEKFELYSEIARAHEAVGDLRGALEAERAASAEQVNAEHRRATNLVLLAQVRYETERERVEARHQRTLAAAEAERATTLEVALDTLEQLRRVGEDITTQLDAAGILRTLDRHLGRLADVSFIGVFVFDPAGGQLRRHCIERGQMLPERDISLADFESYAARVARERRELLVESEEGGRPATRIPGTHATRSLWFGPLLVNERLLGVLTIQTQRLRAYGEREKRVFRTVSGYAAVALANARTHGELEEKHRLLVETETEMRRLATTDPLTGLANRRQFFAAAESEVARARRYGGPLGLIMADLDRFKSINDAGGHGAGDRMLAAVAQVLRGQQRPHDALGRLGGEEFAFVLPGADIDATLIVAERVRAAVEALSIDFVGVRFATTVSLGCSAAASIDALGADDAKALERLVQLADGALYEAKRLGRNRAVRSAAPESSAAAR